MCGPSILSTETNILKNGILNYINKDKLDEAMNPEKFTGSSREICEIAIKNSENFEKFLSGELYD